MASEKDEIEQEEPQQCFVEDCSNKAEYGSYIEPEFITGFQHQICCKGGERL